MENIVSYLLIKIIYFFCYLVIKNICFSFFLFVIDVALTKVRDNFWFTIYSLVEMLKRKYSQGFTGRKGLGQIFNSAYFPPIGTLGKGFCPYFTGKILRFSPVYYRSYITNIIIIFHTKHLN